MSIIDQNDHLHNCNRNCNRTNRISVVALQERKDFAATAAGDVSGTYGAVHSDVDDNAVLATSKSRWSEIVYAFKYYKWHMLGTALSWFLLDVDFYANGIFNHDVTSLILSHGRATTAKEDAWYETLCRLLIPPLQ